MTSDNRVYAIFRRFYAWLKSAGVLKPELAVAGFCFLLPDLLDKPLWMFGIGCGRFVGHTVFFICVVSLVFCVRKWTYGLFALLGGTVHLLSDVGWFMPWFYPFVKYDFPELDFWEVINWHDVFCFLREAALVVSAMCLVVLAWSLLWWSLSRTKKLGKTMARDDQDKSS